MQFFQKGVPKNTGYRILQILFFFLLGTNSLHAQTPPTIQSCGDQVFCITQDDFDLCVEIDVTPGLPAAIDSFTIDWGDGTPVTVVPGIPIPPADQFHTYQLDDFFGTCLYKKEYFVTLRTYLSNGETPNSSFLLTFCNQPTSSFNINPAVICAGTEACFFENACPVEDLSIVSWDYGDGTSGTGLENCHIYENVGVYEVTLTVENPCGTDVSTETVTIIEPAEATAIPEPGYIDFTAPQPILICLDASGSDIEIPMNGDSLSNFETTYEWLSLNGYPNANWTDYPNNNGITPDIPDPTLVFTDTGFVQIILAVDNSCIIPDYDTITFQVLSGSPLIAPNQPDVCESLIYQPNPFNENAIYTINGEIINIWPDTLDVGFYTVECFLENECGDQTTTDEFEVTPPIDAVINSPNDTTLCPGADLLYLEATPIGGVWSPSNSLITNTTGDSTWYNPSPGEIVTLIYSPSPIGCGDPASVNVTVEDGGFTANDSLICSWTNNFQLTATPTPDNWFSTDCPACIVNDSFIVSEMVALGLTTVEVMFETNGNTTLCPSSAFLTIILQDPVASFIMDNFGCSNMPITVDATASVADQPLIWIINGAPAPTTAPPFNLSEGTYIIGLEAIVGDCSAYTEDTITVIDPPPALSFTATPLEGCADLEVTLTILETQVPGVAYNWFLDGVLFSSDYAPANITLGQGLTDTIYTISLGSANNCGGETASQEITVYPKPIVNFGTNLPEYCSGDTICFGNASHGNPSSYLWDFGNGITSTEETPSCIILFTDTIPTVYPVTLIGYNNCGSDTLTKFITINPTDVNAFFSTNQLTACVGEPICFESFSTFGAGVIFDFGDGTTTTNGAPCHAYSTPGTYEISLKVFGCGFDSIFTTVNIVPLPLVEIVLTTTTYCPDDLISISAAPSTILDYFWEFGNNSTDTTSNPQFSYDSPGTYFVKLTGISIDSCLSKDSIQIIVVEPPVAQFEVANDTLCQNEGILFNNNSTGIFTCSWEFGDGEISADCSPTYSYDSAGTYTVTLTITNNNNCKDVTTQQVVVAAQPEPDFTYTLNQSCTPVTASFINLSANAQSYDWTFGNGQTSTDTDPTTVYNQGGSYQVQLLATNEFCARTKDSTLVVYQTPEPIVTLSANEGCAPITINFGAQATGNPTLDYVWDFGDGTFSFEQNPNHSYLIPGDYEVKVLLTSQTAVLCKDSVIEEVTIFEPVLMVDAITHVLCFGEDTGVIDLDTISGTQPFEYIWSNGTVTQDPNNLTAGSYTVSITDANSCILLDTFEVTQPPEILASTLDSAIVTCYGGEDGSLCIGVMGGVADYEINWSNGLVGDCIENISAGDYEVQITDANNCLVDSTFVVYEKPVIAVLDSVADVTCFGEEDGQILLDTITGGFSNLYNTTLTGPVAYDGGTSFSNLLPGAYHLIVQDIEGCSFEKDYIIGEPDSLWMDIPIDSLYLDMGDSIQISMDHNAIQPQLTWTPRTKVFCWDCEDPWVTPFKTTIYQVTLKNQDNCEVNDEATVFVDPNRNYYIPNTFTPNGDGRNDLFRIRSLIPSIQQVTIFRVFDRWGELIFERENFRPQEENDEDAWNGTFRGKELPPDTFTFYIEIEYVDGERSPDKGTITLIR
ncbi:MAG: gliding motility-associated-like protein [Saprospiraceae bacterium]|jgi:gliding motility-associated-like protein